MRSIHTSWSIPLCLGLIHFLQLTANEHKYGLQDDVDDDDVGDTATTDVAIAVSNNAAPLVMATMMGPPEAIAVMVTMTILLAMAPANVTISWTMTTNDDDDDADNGDHGKNSLPPPMTAMTAEIMTGMMGGGGVRRGDATISWTRGTRGA
jgi:hypothetical protein